MAGAFAAFAALSGREYARTARPAYLLYAGLLVCTACLLGLSAVRHRRQSARADRAARGLCVGCGYDLTGNVSGVCPECGTRTRREAG